MDCRASVTSFGLLLFTESVTNISIGGISWIRRPLSVRCAALTPNELLIAAVWCLHRDKVSQWLSRDSSEHPQISMLDILSDE